MISRVSAQAWASVLTNGYLKGFVTGKIFTGVTKHVCVPTLNCYSCPGALFACPVGSVQVILAGGGGLDPTATHTYRERMENLLTSTPLFVIGLLTIIGALVGRATCGWVCPFGFFQELAHKIPSPKFTAPKVLRLLKYVFLVVTVILLPLFMVDSSGFGKPTYCEYVCPAGTLEGGILLPLLNTDLRGMLGKLFLWKMFVLLFFFILMILFRRPFCSWGCPLGAFLSLFNRASLWRLEIDAQKCTHCRMCDKVCPSALHIETELDCTDCIRCLECKNVCPNKIIRITRAGEIESSTPAPAPAQQT